MNPMRELTKEELTEAISATGREGDNVSYAFWIDVPKRVVVIMFSDHTWLAVQETQSRSVQ